MGLRSLDLDRPARAGLPTPIAALLVAAVCIGLGCSEGQVSISQGDMADGQDASGDTTPPADGTTPTGTTNPTTSTNDMTMTTTTPGDTSGGVCMAGERRCSPFSGNLESCTSGAWAELEVCETGCANGACLGEALSGDCTNPAPLVVGQTVVGTTATLFNPNTWSSECRSKDAMMNGGSRSPTGPETVFLLTVTQPQPLKLTVTPQTVGDVALYIRSDCTDPGSEVINTCKASAVAGAQFEIEGFFGAGEYYVFVDDFGTSGTFELSVEPQLAETCGDQVPAALDVSPGGATTMGNTANGQQSEQWAISSSMCGSAMGTTGPENIWVFGLAEQANVNIAVTNASTSENVALYIREECDTRLEDQIRCGFGPGGMNATWSGTLSAGAYYVFVDSFDPTVSFEYLLEIQVN